MNLSSNRIQQNPARNNRPVPNRPATSQRPPVAQANTLSNYGTTTRVRSLFVGQILKGEVSDLRNREIVLTLENNTTVSAHLEGGNWLAIGEISAFKVLSASQEQITLEALPRNDMALANSTIQKALEEAGLPKSPKNQQIVLELMKNQLPIHKQSILQMLQTSFQNQEVSIPTLVLMSKHQIPITPQNAIQFERYQNNAHSLATGLEDLSKDLSSLIRDLSKTLSETNEFVENIGSSPSPIDTLLQGTSPNSPQSQVLQQLFQHTETTPAPQSNNIVQTTVSKILSAILDQTATTNPDSALPSHFSIPDERLQSEFILSETANNDVSLSTPSSLNLPDQTLNFLTNSEREELISILENFELPDFLKAEIQEGTASLRDTLLKIQTDYEAAAKIDQQVEASLISEDTTSIFDENSTKDFQQMQRTTLFDSPVIEKIEQTLQTIQKQTGELGKDLSFQERIELKSLINDFPMDEHAKEQIIDGSFKTLDFLRTIKNILPFTEKDIATPLLSSSIFSKLVEDTFMDQFFLSPKEIFSQGGVNAFYRKLSKQLEDLDSLFEKNLHTKASSNIQQLTNALSIEPKEQVSQLKDNLEFMKLLNQFFSYVQLPTKIQEKFTHADLYVYTKKKNLKQQQQQIRVLLHLNMDNLGDLDVEITLKKRDVTTIFHTANDKVGKLISTNFSLLEDSLYNMGYTSTNQIAKLEKKVDIVKDFIAPESAGHSISRYSFDLRA